MNASRAREYFSAFHEGSLDAGLRQQFQKALASDPKLQEEFADFAIAYEALNFQADEVIEVPMNLSDQIATRLEAAQNAKPRVGFVWQGWFRNLALSGIAAAAILGAGFGIMSKGGNSFTSNMFGTGGGATNVPKNELIFEVMNKSLVVTYTPTDSRPIVVDGKSLPPTNGPLRIPFANRNQAPAAFTLNIDGSKTVETVVIPGKEVTQEIQGSGTILAFAKALASRYQTPVRVSAGETSSAVAWTMTDNNPYEAATAALRDTPYNADKREDGLICITSR